MRAGGWADAQGSETDASIAKRLRTAHTELAFCDSTEGQEAFDLVIVNDDVDAAFAEFVSAVTDYII
jgi:guanylate kinase